MLRNSGILLAVLSLLAAPSWAARVSPNVAGLVSLCHARGDMDQFRRRGPHPGWRRDGGRGGGALPFVLLTAEAALLVGAPQFVPPPQVQYRCGRPIGEFPAVARCAGPWRQMRTYP
jgi:hypothetical protein